jgi:hypothetical protein
MSPFPIQHTVRERIVTANSFPIVHFYTAKLAVLAAGFGLDFCWIIWFHKIVLIRRTQTRVGAGWLVVNNG